MAGHRRWGLDRPNQSRRDSGVAKKPQKLERSAEHVRSARIPQSFYLRLRKMGKTAPQSYEEGCPLQMDRRMPNSA